MSLVSGLKEVPKGPLKRIKARSWGKERKLWNRIEHTGKTSNTRSRNATRGHVLPCLPALYLCIQQNEECTSDLAELRNTRSSAALRGRVIPYLPAQSPFSSASISPPIKGPFCNFLFHHLISSSSFRLEQTETPLELKREVFVGLACVASSCPFLFSFRHKTIVRMIFSMNISFSSLVMCS